MAPKTSTAPRRVTRNDVARHAGVSSAVVSYVVNNGPKRVAPETEQRVRAAVDALGYRPNLAARALSGGRTGTIGLLLTDWLNPYFAELAQAVELAAVARGRAVLMANSNEDPDTERRRMADLDERQVDGLLVTSMLSLEELTRWNATRSHAGMPPTVLMNADGPVPGFLTVGPTFAAGARDATEHLIEHGHRRVALITGSVARTPWEPREQGWRDAQLDAGLRLGPVARGGWGREAGYRLTLELLTSRRAPTAIFTVSDLMAVGALRALHELGMQAGIDVAVACFDGTSESEYSWPPLTAVRQPMTAMAEAAVAAVLNPSEAGAHPHQSFATTLVKRQSCGCSLRSD